MGVGGMADNLTCRGGNPWIGGTLKIHFILDRSRECGERQCHLYWPNFSVPRYFSDVSKK